MSLTITRSRVKEKCGITDTSYDTAIDNLILELAPVLEFAIRSDALADASRGVQATLNLGATEVVSGEFLAQRERETGAYATITIGDLKVKADVQSPDLLKQGLGRLKPFLKGETYASIAGAARSRPVEASS